MTVIRDGRVRVSRAGYAGKIGAAKFVVGTHTRSQYSRYMT